MRFSYVEPTTLDEAVSIMADLCNQRVKSKYLAGGTDLIPLIKYGVVDVDTVINLKFIDGLNCISDDEDFVYIGALTGLNDVAKSKVVMRWVPAVATAAGKVASPGLRNMGTIGGNILQGRRCWYYNQSKNFHRGITPCFATGGKVCHNEPEVKACRRILMSDMVPSLILDGAIIELTGAKGRREALLETLVNVKNGAVNVPQQEIISQIKIPKTKAIRMESYQRMSIRRTIDYPEVSLAIALDIDLEEKKYRTANVVIGSACPGPFKSVKAETIAQGSAIDNELGRRLGDAVAKEIEKYVVKTNNFSKWYKLEMVKKMIIDAIDDFSKITDGGESIG